MHIDYYVPFSVVAAAATGQVCSGVGGGRVGGEEGREGGVSAGTEGGREGIGGGTGVASGHRALPPPPKCEIFLWTLHGKN